MTEGRSRKSTLSKITKIFSGDNKPASSPTSPIGNVVGNLPAHIVTEDSRSTSNASSLNSSSSSLQNLSQEDKKVVPTHQQQQQFPSRLNSKRISPPAEKLSNATISNNNIINPIATPTSHLSRSSSSASHYNSNASTTNTAKNLPRFVVFEDGTHQHHLRNAKRQEKLTNMFKNLLSGGVGNKLRDGAVSAVPDILNSGNEVDPPSLFSGMLQQQKLQQKSGTNGAYIFSGATKVPGVKTEGNTGICSGENASQTFVERYGRCQEVVGKGTFGVVRISHKKEKNGDAEKLFAVKEFKRKPSEDAQKYSKRLTSEFCISSSLKHINIIETLDLLQDAKGDYVEVMEFCSGGDLYTLIIACGKLEYLEADCFFKQLIRGVNYMHEMGITHRDLKPENLLLTSNGTLKITDFGNGECFKMAWETEIHLSNGICGSSPYIAPEEYVAEEFDPRLLDIWACGVIYMAMRTGRHLWKEANSQDEFYRKYLEDRKSKQGYEPIELIKRARCRNVIYSILDPIPSRRINGKQILNSEWGREIKCCV